MPVKSSHLFTHTQPVTRRHLFTQPVTCHLFTHSWSHVTSSHTSRPHVTSSHTAGHTSPLHTQPVTRHLFTQPVTRHLFTHSRASPEHAEQRLHTAAAAVERTVLLQQDTARDQLLDRHIVQLEHHQLQQLEELVLADGRMTSVGWWRVTSGGNVSGMVWISQVVRE